MRSQAFTLLAVAISSACSTAIPTRVAKRDDPRNWNRKGGGGNTNIIFSDDTIRLGTVTIDNIMDKLVERCHDEGLCDTGSIDLQGQLIDPGAGGEVDDITVTVEPSGAYQEPLHNALLDALRAAVHFMAKCEDVTNTPTCPSTMTYCPSEPFTVNECVVPRYWGIVNFGDTTGAPNHIQADLTLKIEGSGLCDTLTGVGEALAGAINGGFGGVFTLAGLLCGDS
ncbi:hypothetical protein F5Y17DRAFT_414061 [Xylariaceae sp. FL0594]|nr:hypothetical protein F5Y17DRAFT_414061 [Xylariaceae sp. FL0594]